jgi:hypothetical protein
MADEQRLANANHGRPIHADHRALVRQSVGTIKAREAQVARLEAARLREHFFEFQVAITGTANARAGWSPISITFPAPMIPAPNERDSDFEVPQFIFGYHLTTATPVVIVAYVIQWVLDESDYTVGARVNIGSFTPDLETNVDFSGFAHLTFQGYSSPALVDDDSGAT